MLDIVYFRYSFTYYCLLLLMSLYILPSPIQMDPYKWINFHFIQIKCLVFP